MIDPMTTVYTANTRAVYRAGAYDGTHSIGELRRHGTFGLGALDHNDGEFVMLDGRAYRTDQDGTTAELGGSATTPYAAVLPFEPVHLDSAPTWGAKNRLEDRLAETLLTAGRGCAVRIHGVFGYVEAGASAWQRAPYRPLNEVFGEYNWLRHERTRGSLVGLAMPECFASIDVPGFHFHWLSDDRRQGGHVTDYVAEDVRVEVCETTRFTFDIASGE
jgi:acetolactate decarboxylase